MLAEVGGVVCMYSVEKKTTYYWLVVWNIFYLSILSMYWEE
jgi:hypothetical protein